MKNFYRLTIVVAASLAVVLSLQAQWIKQTFPTTEALYKVRFADTQTGWILGTNNLYKTTDGGASWMPQKATSGYGQAVHVLNSTVLFHANFGQPLERSTDGGNIWTVVDTNGTAYFDFDFISPLIGYAAGGVGSPLQAVIRKTTNGGETWTTMSTGFSAAEIEGVSFVNEQVGWAVSYWGLMYMTTNSGQVWNFQDTVGRANFGFNAPVRDVQFTTADSGWAVGGLSSNNVIARTTNGGTTWTYLNPGGTSWREIQMRNSQLGWTIGATYSPYIARTTNGGESWEGQTFSTPPNPTRGLESICMIDDNLGWVVGGLGDVYKTTNGGAGALSVGENWKPYQFGLSQNYPNPFNPTTNIEFQIANRKFVSLKVFDVLGREVTTLVDEVKEPGEYSVTFDASNLSSGMYFYRLMAGGYAQTKRLVLLR